MGTPVLLFDGDCAFCSTCARWLERRVPTQAGITAWQHTDLDALGVTVDEVTEAVQWVTSSTHHTSGPVAVADLLLTSNIGWRTVGRVLKAKPVLWVAWPVYRWIARNRHRMPGGTPACSLRSPGSSS